MAQGDHKKMSRSAFVRNTMNAVSVQCHQQLGDAISIQEEHRASNVTLQSIESHDLKRSPSCKSASSSNNGSISRGGGGSYSFDVPSMTPMTLTFGSKSWQAEIEVSLRVSNYNSCDVCMMHADDLYCFLHCMTFRKCIRPSKVARF